MAEQADGVLAMIAADRAELIEDFGSELAAHALIAGTDDPAPDPRRPYVHPAKRPWLLYLSSLPQTGFLLDSLRLSGKIAALALRARRTKF